MKIRIVSCLLLILTVMNKINSQTIVYSQSIVIDNEDFKSKSGIDELDEDEQTISELNEINIDTEKLISKLTPNEKEEKHFYTIADDQIRYRRNLTKSSSLFNEEWISINRNSRTMNHYYISKDKSSKVTKSPLDRTAFRDVKVTYETTEDKMIKK